MCFAYTVPGRTFDRERPRVAPYIATATETRLLFRKSENVRDRCRQAENPLSDTGMGDILEHLTHLMRLWDELSATPVPASDDVLDRVQAVINLVCVG